MLALFARWDWWPCSFWGPRWAIYASFTNMALVGADAANPRFVGLANYVQLFRDPDFLTVMRNSVAFVVGSAVSASSSSDWPWRCCWTTRSGVACPAATWCMPPSCWPGSTRA